MKHIIFLHNSNTSDIKMSQDQWCIISLYTPTKFFLSVVHKIDDVLDLMKYGRYY